MNDATDAIGDIASDSKLRVVGAQWGVTSRVLTLSEVSLVVC